MTRLTAVDPATASGKTKELFDGVQKQLGSVPNLYRTAGNSSAALEGLLSLSGALGKGSLGPKLGNKLALLVAETNQCNYCLSAHSYLGEHMAKLTADEMSQARNAVSDDPKTQAALQYARTLVLKRGLVNDADVAAVKDAGYTDGQIAEIVGHVVVNIFTNYLNNTAGTEIDFPVVTAHIAVAAN